MEDDNPTRECYDTLVKAYDYFNQALFDQKLPAVVITFHRQRKIMGYASIGRWVNRSKNYKDELAVNPEYFARFPLIEICQTLCHEMVHIWQAHFGKPGRRGYHNIEWARKMTEIGLIPSSTGKPGGLNTGEYMMDYVLFEGPFHVACRKLIKTGYELPWVDRYPIFRLDLPVTAYDEKKVSLELDKNLNCKTNTASSISEAMRTQDLAAGELSDSYSSGFNGDFEDEDDLSSLTSKPRSRSGRVKYACKVCQMLLWGKPGLNVVCGDCETKMSEIV